MVIHLVGLRRYIGHERKSRVEILEDQLARQGLAIARPFRQVAGKTVNPVGAELRNGDSPLSGRNMAEQSPCRSTKCAPKVVRPILSR